MSEGDHLDRMLGAYFDRAWAAQGGAAEERLSQMLEEAPADLQNEAAREIRRLLDGRLCENQIRDVLLYEVGCHYAFERDGLEASSWLRHVHERIVRGLGPGSRPSSRAVSVGFPGWARERPHRVESGRPRPAPHRDLRRLSQWKPTPRPRPFASP